MSISFWYCMGGCGRKLSEQGYCNVCSPPADDPADFDPREPARVVMAKLKPPVREAPPYDPNASAAPTNFLDFGLMAAIKRRTQRRLKVVYDERLEAEAELEREALRARAARAGREGD